MKKTLLAASLFFAVSASFAQSVATTVSYNKSDQPALVLELPYNQAMTEDFIVAHLKKTGYAPQSKSGVFGKTSKINGYYTFKAVRVDSARKQDADLYFRVEPKSKLQPDHSIVYLLVGKDDGSFVSPEANKPLHSGAKKFLDGFVPGSAAYKLDLDIEEQEYLVKDNETRLGKLKEEEKALQKKLEALQTEMKKNHDLQEDQKKALANEQRKLAELKGRH